MTVTVAYVENDENGIPTPHIYPSTVSWAYVENDANGIPTVHVYEFPPVLTVEGDSVTLHMPESGVLTYEEWGEYPSGDLSARPHSPALTGSGGSSLAASRPAPSLTAESTEASIA